MTIPLVPVFNPLPQAKNNTGATQKHDRPTWTVDKLKISKKPAAGRASGARASRGASDFSGTWQSAGEVASTLPVILWIRAVGNGIHFCDTLQKGPNPKDYYLHKGDSLVSQKWGETPSSHNPAVDGCEVHSAPKTPGMIFDSPAHAKQWFQPWFQIGAKGIHQPTVGDRRKPFR